MAPPDSRFLEWRLRLFGVGAILAMFGIFAEMDWMVSLAIGALAIAVVLGLLSKRWSVTLDADEEEEDDEAAGGIRSD